MPKLHFVAAIVAIAAIAGLSPAQAQQNTLRQRDPIQQQPAGSQTDQADRYEARRVSPDAQRSGTTVKEAIVQKLQKANEAEIELAKMAQQKTDNQEIRQLTQTMIQDHQSLNQELQQFSGSRDSRTASNSRTGSDSRTASTSRTGSDSRTASTSRTSSDSSTAIVPTQLCQIAEQACDNSLKMTKDMLSNYEGQNFNMAFLGQQSVAHTMMLAELKAIESEGPQELQPIVQQAITKVEQHLEKAKQLAKKLEDDSKSKSSS